MGIIYTGEIYALSVTPDYVTLIDQHSDAHLLKIGQHSDSVVISGGQLNRTAIFDEPTPTDVYPDIPRYVQAPEPIYLGKTEFRMIGMPPGRQIWPPWVCPLSIRLKSTYAASS